MDTQTPSAPKIPAIRTYAKDLEMKRKEKGLPPESAEVAVKKETPKAAPAVEVKNAPRIQLFKRTAPEVTETSTPVTPLPPLSSIPKKAAPIPKIIANDTRETSFIVDNEDAASATIITDTKRDRFKLFPAIVSSIKSWFSDQKKSYAAKKVPKYTVPETTRRKGVIQKATSKTGKFTSSDFESIQERIRQRKEAEEKPKSTTTWSANTEPGFPLLEGEVSEPKVANVQVVPRKSFRTPTPVPAPTPAPAPVVVVKKVEPAPAPLPEPEPVVEEPEVFTPEPEEVIVEPEILEAPEPIEVEERKNQPFNLLQIRTNLLALGFSGLVLALAVAGFYGYFILKPEPAVTTTITTNPTPQFTASDLSIVTLSTIDDQSITEALAAVRTEGAEFSEVLFMQNTNATPVPAHILFTGMKLNIPRDFAQTIADVRFGYVKGNPYMYAAIKDEAAARGGLLAWEGELYNSFREIYSTVLMPEESAPSFVDATLSGTDVRVLKHTNGQELLLYSLVDGGAIITTGSASLAELMNQLQ